MGTFDIAVSGAAMPVAIEYFRGTKQNSRNVLDWKVSCTGSLYRFTFSNIGIGTQCRRKKI